MELAPLALTIEEKWILIIILIAVMTLVVFFEVRIMRGKAKEVRRASQRRDEAHNALLTTDSVLGVVAREGADVDSARTIVNRARDAYSRREYGRTMDLCESARLELRKCKRPTYLQPEPEAEASDDLERLAEEIVRSDVRPSHSDTYKGTKLPADEGSGYMGAKFEVGAAREDLKRAAEEGRDTAEAEETLAGAEAEFEGGNYARALSLAIKARKRLSETADSDTIQLSASGVREETEGEALKCTSCRSMILPDDDFCAQCGAPAKLEPCPECGREPTKTDKFCRKCGTKLR
ncbi:MAG: zinc ribbon domain-containing protein [Methanobacteriota archaeon]|nr:MAG: zinc ribbon domain-containing protein [Euryarchaeota archaeon]